MSTNADQLFNWDAPSQNGHKPNTQTSTEEQDPGSEETQSSGPTMEELAREYRHLGFTPLPVKGKQPWDFRANKGLSWKGLDITPDDYPRYFSGATGIGAILGREPLYDTEVDCDCAEARIVAAAILPPTHRKHGRTYGTNTVQVAHYWYHPIEHVRTVKFSLRLKSKTVDANVEPIDAN